MSPTVGVVVGVLVAVATAACDPCAPTERPVAEGRVFESPLHEAVWRADAERVAELLAQGEDPNKAVEGGTPLSLAVTAGNYSVVKTLLETHADPNGGTSEGWTPLMVAAQFDRATLAAALLGAGADVNAQDDRGGTALLYAAAERSIQVATLLLKAGADPNIRTRDGRTALSESKTRKREFHFGSWMFVWGSKVADDDELVRLLREAGAK